MSGADDRLVKIWDYQVNEKKKFFSCIFWCHWWICLPRQNKNCVQTLSGHAQNISAVSFHPDLPIILTGSEDGKMRTIDVFLLLPPPPPGIVSSCFLLSKYVGTIRIWHANTYRLETTLNYGLERVWAIDCMKGSNSIAIGYDEGSVVLKVRKDAFLSAILAWWKYVVVY